MYGVSGQSYSVPELLSGATNLGFMVLPNYRAWVVLVSLVVCLGTWYMIERTRLGAYLRAGTENAQLVQAFGIKVPTPPSNVIKITSPDIDQCTSDKVAKPMTSVLSEPASPASAAESTKASSL